MNWTKICLGLSAAVGGFVAVLSDVLQKNQASAVDKIDYSLQTTLSVSSHPVLVMSILIGLAVALCFIFGAESNKRAFYIGASIPSILMTLVPYELPKSLPPAPVPATGLVPAPGPQHGTLLGPWKVFAQSEQPEAARARVEVHVRTQDNRPIDETVFTLIDQRTQKIFGRSKVRGGDFAFYVPTRPIGSYLLRVEVVGYQTMQLFFQVLPNHNKSISISLESSSLPLQIQRLFKIPTQPAPETPYVRLKLDEIEVKQDGGPGTTRWGFDVFANDRLLFSVPEKRFDDKASPPRYPMGAGDKTEARVEIPAAQDISLRIAGYRPPRAEGHSTVPAGLAASGKGIDPVRVTVPGNPRDGDFQFQFSFSSQPATTQNASAVASLRLDDITVYEDGGVGATKWLFDVFMDDRLLFTVPERSYDDKASPPKYSPRPEDNAAGNVGVAAEYFTIRVCGHRTPPRADGSIILSGRQSNSESPNKVIPVRVPQNPRKGDFNFLVSIERH